MKKETKEDTLEIKLIDEISSPSVTQIATDFSEVALDSILENGILKDLPGFSILTGIVKTTRNIREKIFAKKLLLFLQSLNECDLGKRQEFVTKLNGDQKEKQKIGETLLIILERLENMEKPKIIGNLFKAYLEEQINYKDFTKVSGILSRIQLEDLMVLKNREVPLKDMPTDTLEYLAMNGLMNIGILDQPLTMDMTKISPTLFYTPNKNAHMLFKYGF